MSAMVRDFRRGRWLSGADDCPIHSDLDVAREATTRRPTSTDTCQDNAEPLCR